MPDLKITVAGDERQVATGTTAADLFGGDRSIVDGYAEARSCRVAREGADPARLVCQSRWRSSTQRSSRSSRSEPRARLSASAQAEEDGVGKVSLSHSGGTGAVG